MELGLIDLSFVINGIPVSTDETDLLLIYRGRPQG
jgi:hypothetical protein